MTENTHVNKKIPTKPANVEFRDITKCCGSFDAMYEMLSKRYVEYGGNAESLKRPFERNFHRSIPT